MCNVIFINVKKILSKCIFIIYIHHIRLSYT
ncbi:hypothetical protein, partial [Plasmodium yoelii yoelii]